MPSTLWVPGTEFRLPALVIRLGGKYHYKLSPLIGAGIHFLMESPSQTLPAYLLHLTLVLCIGCFVCSGSRGLWKAYLLVFTFALR